MKPPTTSGLPAEALFLQEPGVPEDPSLAPPGGAGDPFPPPSLDTVRNIFSGPLTLNLEKAGYPKLADRKRRCGRDRVYFECPSCGKEIWVHYRCKLRTCTDCARALSAQKRRKYAHLEKIPHLKHVTVTTPNLPLLTRPAIQAFIADIAQLRKELNFRLVWPGGLRSIEVSYSPQTGWNLHAHLIVEGIFVHQKKIRTEWERIQGGQRVVHIKEVRGPHEGLKYALKPSKLVLEDPELLRQFVEATRGVRLIELWGCWRKNRLPVLPDPVLCPDCGLPFRFVITLPHLEAYFQPVRAPPG